MKDFQIRDRALDLNGTKEGIKLSDGMRTDYKEIRSDWDNIGRIIRGEIKTYF